MTLRERDQMHVVGDDYVRSLSGIYIPPPSRRVYDRPIGIDLFAGAGGFSCGFHKAGYHVVAALEFDPIAAMTYAVNLGDPSMRFHFDTDERRADWLKRSRRDLKLVKDMADEQVEERIYDKVGTGWIAHYFDCDGSCERCQGFGYDGSWNEFLAEVNARPPHGEGCEHMWVADAKNVTGAEILDALGLQQGDVDVVFGGPPCQGFSISGKRNVVDPRNSLVFEFVRLVLEIQPKALVMENVPGIMNMTTPEGTNVVDALCRVLEDNDFGYYDALRRSLLASSGAGAALRSKATPKKKRAQREAKKTAANAPKQGAFL